MTGGNDHENSPSDKKKRNHLLSLRNITARILREESEFNLKNAKSKNKSKTMRNVTASDNDIILPEPFQKLKPWVESSTIEEETPWIEASPADILTVQEQSDTMTEHTALCSVFEMLSFENLCGGGQTSVPRNSIIIPSDLVEPAIKVLGHSPAADDGFMVPREISFENQDVCGGCVNVNEIGCSSVVPDKVLHIVKRQSSTSAFMKRLLPFKPAKVAKGTHVMKVKVYVDSPGQQGSNISIGNSTLTYPKELLGNNTSMTI